MSTTRVYLIRHGSTSLSAEDRFSGGTEVDLSDEGRWQAACLAKRLADDQISAIYCSPMRRTVETLFLYADPTRRAARDSPRTLGNQEQV